MNVTLNKKEREVKLLTGHHAWLMIDDKKSPKDFKATELLFIEEIRHRAETMTPLLKGILEFRPNPHWHH